MDNLRFLLFVALGSLSILIWQAWEQDYGPKPELTAEQHIEDSPVVGLQADLPESPALSKGSGSIPSSEADQQTRIDERKKIRVITDVLRVEIDTLGGNVVLADLLQYPQNKDNPEKSIRLFDDNPDRLYFSQSGLITGEKNAPDHSASWNTVEDEYVLRDDQDSFDVPLTWVSKDGVVVNKVYTFSRGSYLIQQELNIKNDSTAVFLARQYSQLQRKDFKAEEKDSGFIRTYTGAVTFNDEDKYQKIDFDDMGTADLSLDVEGGWSAYIQHYFLSAWVPPPNETNHFYTKSLPDQRYVVGSYSSQFSVEPGQEKTVQAKLVVGPKVQRMLEKIAPELDLTVDYSHLTVIAKPIFWLLEKLHSYLGNWGWAIIGVTLVIKALFFKLSETSYRSMARMRKLTPKLKALRERFAEDKKKMNEEIMALYKREKVNPLGGCFPILVQIPVFISLYWVIIETVELRHAPFALWLNDLSARDPFFVLPILMGVTMFVQQRLNPTPVDPVQEKVMKWFPFMFTIFFLFFPSGLVLYWVVNNTLSIIQQAYITKQIERSDST
ncbi:MAG: membrane protein insertase YidC [Methylococcales bacterium]